MIQVYENGVWNEYEHFVPYSFNLKKNEDLDNAMVARYARSDSKFPLLTKVKLVDGDNVTDWVVVNCSNERVGPSLWKQTIELTEPTEILKGYPLENITITQPIDPDTNHLTKSLFAVIDHLIEVAIPHREGDSYLRDTLWVRTDEVWRLSGIQSPEFSFTEMTIFDALIEIGSYLDSMPKLEINENGKLYLFFEPLDIKEKRNYSISNLLVEKKEQPLSNYAEEVVSAVNNLHTGSPVVYPAENMGVYVDAGDTSNITEGNARITLPYKIKKILKFEGFLSGGWQDYTKYVYEDGFWKILHPIKHGDDTTGIPDYQRRPNTIHYSYNSNVIEFGEFFVLKPAIQQYIFKITFIPIYDTRIKEANVDNPMFTVINNQSASLVEGNAFSQKLKNYIKRMRYGDYIAAKRFKNYLDIPEPGHLVNNQYVVTNVAFTRYNDFYDVVLELSEGYTRRAEFIRAKQDIRSWEIPADGRVVERQINYKEKIKFSLGVPLYGNSTAPCVRSIEKVLNNLFYGSAYDGLFAVINFETMDGVIPIILTTVIGPVGNNLTFNFKAIDNTLIGYSKSLNFVNKVTMQQGVTYTDSYGNFEKMTVGFTSDFFDTIDQKTFSQNYPISTVEQNNQLFPSCFIKINNLIVQKDASSILNFTYQLALEGENGTVIHNNLAQNALYQKAKVWDLYFYFLNRKVYSENETIKNSDIIGYARINEVINQSNMIVYKRDLTSQLANIPDQYESVAIGLEMQAPTEENFMKPMIIQNNVSEGIKNAIKNIGSLALYYVK